MEFKTPQEAYDKAAQERGFENWDNLCWNSVTEIQEEARNEAIELYAESKAKSAWEMACEFQKEACYKALMESTERTRFTAVRNTPTALYEP